MVYTKAAGWLLLFALGAWLLVTVMFGDGDTDTTARLETALCEDLDSGMSAGQLVPQVIDRYDGDRARASVFMDEAIRERCPEHVDDWEAQGLYQQFH